MAAGDARCTEAVPASAPIPKEAAEVWGRWRWCGRGGGGSVGDDGEAPGRTVQIVASRECVFTLGGTTQVIRNVYTQ